MADSRPIDRISPTHRPSGAPLGYQTWCDLLFIHWRVPVEVVRQWIPEELTIDTWEGDAWIGLVPFTITGSRPRWVPALPGISSFHETNVRTYVHHAGANPGVWFFSLDAATSLGVQVARRFLSLPYYRADMSIRRRDAGIQYESQRRWPGPLGASHSIRAEIGALGAVPNTTPEARAIPDTLEHFLIERYLLYTVTPDGRVLRGQVHHAPYPLRGARVTRLEQTMLSANGLAAPDAPVHVVFSDRVDVEIFPIVPPPAPPPRDRTPESASIPPPQSASPSASRTHPQ